MPARPRCQFSLLVVMGAIAIVSVIATNWFVVLWGMSLYFPISTAAIATIAFVAGNRTRLTGLNYGRIFWMRTGAYTLLGVCLIGTCAAFWTAQRWERVVGEPSWPLPPPYPDTFLDAYFEWVFELRSPPSTEPVLRSGTTDYLIVLITTYAIFWLFVALLAFQIGLMFKSRPLWQIIRAFRDLGSTISRHLLTLE